MSKDLEEMSEGECGHLVGSVPGRGNVAERPGLRLDLAPGGQLEQSEQQRGERAQV